ncbi:MAG: metal ABC transporter permease [Spirochaetia bacterium]|jgi:zinc transport system permease protein|nr:metal ABC transporter permease [Spirochaetia bacterium]
MIQALFHYHFLQNAFFATLLASIVCGLIGTIIVEKKLILMGGGIAHTAYGGVGLGYLLGFDPMLGAMGFSTLAALAIGHTRRKGEKDGEVTIALFWSLGMALGILFTSLMPGYPPDMNSYLFGNILAVTDADLLRMLLLTVIVVFLLVALFADWKAYLFDPEFARLSGMKVTFLEYLLLVLIALSVVVLIRLVGIILLIAMISAPAATASLLSRKLKSRMFLAMLIGEAECLAGLALSYTLDLASGAIIVIIAVAVQMIVRLVNGKVQKLTTEKG